MAKPHRRSRNRSKTGRPNIFGAVDLGTNNCRLLVAKAHANGFQVIDSYSRVVRLGAGLSSTGMLSQKSMDAAVAAIGVCASKMKNKGVRRWRCIATQACRQAGNGEEFMRRVKQETGLSFEIISPRVESRLAVMGCIGLADLEKDVVLVVDIGGGSSELSWVDARKLRDSQDAGRIHRPPISAWASLPVGVVTLSELVPDKGNSPAALLERFEEMKDNVRRLIDKAGCQTRFTNAFKEGRGHIIGTSGTITSLTSVHLKLPYYQRDKVDGIWVDTADIVAMSRRMALSTLEERAAEPCIGTDRAGLLVAGCAIMDVLCTMWPSQRIRVADRGLREGMLIGLMDQSRRGPKPGHRPKNSASTRTAQTTRPANSETANQTAGETDSGAGLSHDTAK